MNPKSVKMRGTRALSLMLSLMLLLSMCLTGCGGGENVAAYREKAELLKDQLVTEAMRAELGTAPVSGIGNIVYLSVSDGQARAQVYQGKGETLEKAWEAADKQARKGLGKSGLNPVWVKGDVVYITETVSQEKLAEALGKARNSSLRYGIAFDEAFKTSLLEAELNSCGIYDYENKTIDLKKLNDHLKNAGKKQVKTLPETYTVFQTFSRFCGEDNTIVKISASGQSYGRRAVETPDAALADQMVRNAAAYLTGQIGDNGMFAPGWDARSDLALTDGGMQQQALALWALVYSRRMSGEAQSMPAIDRAADFLTAQLVSRDEESAFIGETKGGIELGGTAAAVIALTEYTEAFGTQSYLDACLQLGRGILAMQNPDDGSFSHVLNQDFSVKEQTRDAAFDGMAAYALCRLFDLTGDQAWLDAAKAAGRYMVAADHVQYADPWVAFAFNALTKYADDSDFYAFALRNVQENLETLGVSTTSPEYLMLLMNAFEVYDRLTQKGAVINGFDAEKLLELIGNRAGRMLNGCVWPETAMYLANPARVEGAFMIREAGMRVHIEDLYTDIVGFCLYQRNYDQLIAYGMPEAGK